MKFNISKVDSIKEMILKFNFSRFVVFAGFLVFLQAGCQHAPTTIMEETVDALYDRTVLIDTRQAFKYASYHIEGSINLETSSFLIIKNPKSNLRQMDPDLMQTIERLARRGVTPNKNVILLSDIADDLENKKWNWLLIRLEITDVQRISIAEFKKQLVAKRRVDRFATPKSEDPWVLHTSSELLNDLILKKSQDCFVNWSDAKCK